MTAAGTEILSIPDRRRREITQIIGLLWRSAVKTRAGGFFPDFRAAIDAGVICDAAIGEVIATLAIVSILSRRVFFSCSIRLYWNGFRIRRLWELANRGASHDHR